MIKKKAFPFVFVSLNYLFGQGFWGSGFPEEKSNTRPRNYVCYKADSPLFIDGKLDDIGWSRSDWTESFVDIEGRPESLEPYL